jgi:hypothetical protein
MLVLAWQRVNKVKEVAAILKAIHAQEDRHAAAAGRTSYCESEGNEMRLTSS